MAKPDYTYLAVRRQLQGMGADGYEVGVRDRNTGKMLPRTYSEAEVLKSVSWLKRQNTQNCDIYIRPQGSQGLILMDDLTFGTIEKMNTDGVNPAAIIETSPFNLQAWVRVSEEPIAQDLATAIAKHLAKRYDADPNSADWRHYGRLAGFTNRKPEYGSNGKFPFVKAHACNEKIAAMASKLLSEGHRLLEATQPTKKQIRPIQGPKNDVSGHSAIRKPLQAPQDFFQRYLNALIAEFGINLDESRADWMIAKRMAILDYEEDAIRQAIYALSPNLEARKKGHVDDYVNRTLVNVLADPEVREAREKPLQS